METKCQEGPNAGLPGPCPENKPEATAGRPTSGGEAPHHAQKLIDTLEKHIDGQEQLDLLTKIKYKAAVNRVLQKMPPAAVKRFANHTKRIAWYPDRMSMTQDIHKDYPELNLGEAISRGGTLGGGYAKDTAKLYLDGPYWADEVKEYLPPSHGLAHELSHAVDGPDEELSNSPEWQEAFQAELAGGQLSKYGSTKPAEGWAEFGRWAWAYGAPKEEMRKKLPKCTAVWEKAGLL